MSKKSLVLSALRAVSLASLTMISAPSHALFGADAVICLNCVTSIEFGVQSERLIRAIQGASTAITTAQAESSRVIAEAQAKTEASMEKTRIENRFELMDPCSVMSTSQAGSNVDRRSPAASGRGASGGGGPGASSGGRPTAGASGEMQRALQISSGAMIAPPPEIQASLASQGACSTFVVGGARERACVKAGFSLGNANGHPNADTRAETLFDGPQTTADLAKGVRRRLTVPDGNTAEKTAIAAFVRNMETPVDLRELTVAEAKSDAGRNYMGLRDSYEAAMSLATKPMRDQESFITANKDYLPILNQLLRGGDAGFINKHLTEAFPSWRTNGISLAEMINLEAVRRFMNPDWQLRIATSNPQQLQIEQVQMQAAQLWMTSMLLERIQHMSIINGATAGAALRQEKLPGLVKAHQAAQR